MDVVLITIAVLAVLGVVASVAGARGREVVGWTEGRLQGDLDCHPARIRVSRHRAGKGGGAVEIRLGGALYKTWRLDRTQALELVRHAEEVAKGGVTP